MGVLQIDEGNYSAPLPQNATISPQICTIVTSTRPRHNLYSLSRMAGVASECQESLMPAVYRLNVDVLWRIFVLNTELDDQLFWLINFQHRRRYLQRTFLDDLSHHPLVVSRHTSQVCRQWRQVMLLPSLWGNMIDLELLRQPSDHWRLEILRRTEESPLSIYGEIGDNDNAKPFLFSLLTSHWRRIRRVELRLFTPLDKGFLKTLSSPAPNLQALCIDYGRQIDQTLVDRRNLFLNKAPLLQCFHFPGLAFNSSAPWVTNLRSLTVSGSLPLQDLFLALQSTPLLEFLAVRGAMAGSLEPPYPKPSKRISLPHLSVITFEYNFLACLSILGTLIPSSSCVLQVSIGDTVSSPVQDLSAEDIEEFQVALSRYTRRFTTSASITWLSWHYHGDSFGLHAYEASGINVRVCLCTMSSRWITLYSSLLATLGAFQLSNVTRFSFHLSQELEHDHNQQLISVLSSLSAVEVISMTQDALLFYLSNHRLVSFPSLHTLGLYVVASLNPDDLQKMAEVPAILLSFLQKRIEISQPIRVLDLTQQYALEDFRFLEDITGLRVRWLSPGNNIEEYVCGSGIPERLNLVDNHSIL